MPMALRDQPYLPLYVQDYLTDEKLNECSASTQGIYIKIMCILHKSEEYGKFLLEQKYKQTDNQIKNFALKFVKHLPFSENEIFNALVELISENVLILENDTLYQKRMVKDNQLSIARAEAGKKGGEKSKFAQAKHKANAQAKHKANTEYEYEYEYENENELAIVEKVSEKKVKPIPPPEMEFLDYIYENSPETDLNAARLKYRSWVENGWRDGNNQPIKRWKSKALSIIIHLPKLSEHERTKQYVASRLQSG